MAKEKKLSSRLMEDQDVDVLNRKCLKLLLLMTQVFIKLKKQNRFWLMELAP